MKESSGSFGSFFGFEGSFGVVVELNLIEDMKFGVIFTLEKTKLLSTALLRLRIFSIVDIKN